MAKIRKEEAMETPVSAMIDVVFLLIIFFIVTAVFDDSIIDESIMLAQAKHQKEVDKSNPLTMIINVTKDGGVNMGIMAFGDADTERLDGLESLLRTQKNKHGDTLPILIRADADTDFKHVNKVLKAVTDAGLWRVKVAAEIPE